MICGTFYLDGMRLQQPQEIGHAFPEVRAHGHSEYGHGGDGRSTHSGNPVALFPYDLMYDFVD